MFNDSNRLVLRYQSLKSLFFFNYFDFLNETFQKIRACGAKTVLFLQFSPISASKQSKNKKKNRKNDIFSGEVCVFGFLRVFQQSSFWDWFDKKKMVAIGHVSHKNNSNRAYFFTSKKVKKFRRLRRAHTFQVFLLSLFKTSL